MSFRGDIRRQRFDPAGFIRENLRLVPVPSLPAICLYTAHPASGLRRLIESTDDEGEAQTPYWAFPWAGGMALARYILERPATAADRRVLDLGAGSGIVAIAAAKAGAREVVAVETDPHARTALDLNAAANGVMLKVMGDDLTSGPAPRADLVVAGDLFYDRGLAGRVTGFLDRCLAAGIEVLVGDPGRAYLPRSRLRLLAEYPMPDFGDGKNAAANTSAVFSFEPDGSNCVGRWAHP